MIVCVSVVGHQNNPLYIQSFTDADDALKLHHVVHCSLDVIEERVHVAEDVKPKKVLVRHLETLTDSETPLDIIHSLFESDLDEQSCSKGMFIAEKGTVLDKSCTSATDHCTECSVQANMAE